MTYSTIAADLEAGRAILLDGATGTELQRRGADMEPTAWCGAANVEHARTLTDIHLDYIQAGSRVVTANTFATSRMVLKRAGLGDKFAEINKVAVDAAMRARDESGQDIAVAGSLSHMVPRPDLHGPPDPSEVYDAYHELAYFLAKAGCDLLLLEMMFRPERIAPALDAADESGLPTWCGFSARRAEDDSVISFAFDDDIPFGEITPMIDGRNIRAAGVMHSESAVTGDALAILRKTFEGPMTAYPDSGHMKMPDWQFEEIIDPTDLVEFAHSWRQQGVQVFGGCCGLGPDHIAALQNMMQEADA
ncbi:MAG: homocysteine S-methyltransferase family protein [Pseudomonadota bacterium]